MRKQHIPVQCQSRFHEICQIPRRQAALTKHAFEYGRSDETVDIINLNSIMLERFAGGRSSKIPKRHDAGCELRIPRHHVENFVECS